MSEEDYWCFQNQFISDIFQINYIPNSGIRLYLSLQFHQTESNLILKTICEIKAFPRTLNSRLNCLSIYESTFELN